MTAPKRVYRHRQIFQDTGGYTDMAVDYCVQHTVTPKFVNPYSDS